MRIISLFCALIYLQAIRPEIFTKRQKYDNAMDINKEQLEEFLQIAIKEDVGDGDHTSLSTIPANHVGKARLIVKEDGVIAGIEVAKMVFEKLDAQYKFTQLLQDGDLVKKGDIAFYVESRTIALLQAERLVLNIMQRMSGIATQTRMYVDKLEGLHTKVLDTRKTTPGMRLLDKYSVKVGGGVNHPYRLVRHDFN